MGANFATTTFSASLVFALHCSSSLVVDSGVTVEQFPFHFDLEVFLFLLLLYLYVPVFKTRACFTFNLYSTEYEYGETLTSSIRFISFFDSKQYLCIVLVNLQITL